VLRGKDSLSEDEKKVLKHIDTLTSGANAEYRVGRTVGDLPSVWPQFLPKEGNDIPSEVLKEGYYLCIKALASLVGYSGDIPTDLDSMQRVFAEESMRAEVRKMVRDMKEMDPEEKLDEKYIADEVVYEEVLEQDEPQSLPEQLPPGYSKPQSESREVAQEPLQANAPEDAGTPAVNIDVAPSPSYAVESYEQLEEGAEYTLIMSSGGRKSIGPSFVFGDTVAENIIKTFFSNPYYEVVRADQADLAISGA
jgi:hypothetical protein